MIIDKPVGLRFKTKYRYCVRASTWSITCTSVLMNRRLQTSGWTDIVLEEKLGSMVHRPVWLSLFLSKTEGTKKPKKISSSTQFVCYIQYSSLTLFSRTVYNQKKERKKEREKEENAFYITIPTALKVISQRSVWTWLFIISIMLIHLCCGWQSCT